MIPTDHQIVYKSAENLSDIKEDSVDLVVTSPPYPMIEMWDKDFSIFNPEIGNSFEAKKYAIAFESV